MVSVVVHTNMNLANQRESASWLKAGFKRHGIDAEVTVDRFKAADVHVVQGPWYALKQWQPVSDRHRVLYLDRGFWGDARLDISLGWLRPDGSRDFRNSGATVPKRARPAVQPRKDRRRCAIIFADYGEDCTDKVKEARQRFDAVFFRPHPAHKQETPVMTLPGDLDACWEIGDVAIGHSSTVLVKALINGLEVESTDPRHVVHDCTDSREAWLTRLTWAQWHADELQAGDFWDHLCTL